MRASWKIYAAVVIIQIIILLSIPLQRVYLISEGRQIDLPIEPVDPFDPFGGYYVQLQYGKLSYPGSNMISDKYQHGNTVYAVLEEINGNLWQVSEFVTLEQLDAVKGKEVILKGKTNRGRVEYNIERYYIDEKTGIELEKKLIGASDKRARISVVSDGRALIRAVIVDGQEY